MNITTNNQARELLSLYDFSEAEQKRIRSDYDWMDVEDLESTDNFFRYRSSIYHLKDFLAIRDKEGPLGDWDGYSADSYFNGVLVRFSDDYDFVVVGRFLC